MKKRVPIVICLSLVAAAVIVLAAYSKQNRETENENTGEFESSVEIVGNWTVTESPEMTEDAKTALEKACETLTGAEYTPVVLLATRVASGTYYLIFCESRPSVPSPERGYVIVTVYADPDGNAEITDTFEFMLGNRR